MQASKTVLFVDDARFIRERVKNTLSGLGLPFAYTFLEASNGEDAVKIVESNSKIDLILLDKNMPKLNGIEFLKMIRAKPALATIPIIMLTAENSSYDVTTSIEAGADDFIAKTAFTAELLTQKLKRIGFISKA